MTRLDRFKKGSAVRRVNLNGDREQLSYDASIIKSKKAPVNKKNQIMCHYCSVTCERNIGLLDYVEDGWLWERLPNGCLVNVCPNHVGNSEWLT